ncbi:hypothetical protein FOZ60_010155 [Perkinsus olseni]|uniref:Uncharacterized protein n=2 Tax=Perkinsus olseni TaxID=32597 RepID=A0A7J6PCT3_PEROL|nr:hypothetical protein FOZ60_010155 [Perkinsus olseni]
MSPPQHGSQSGNKTYARVVGSGVAGMAELCIFYPVDTLAKRLMNSSVALNANNWQTVVFQQEAGSAAIGGVRGFVGKWAALFPGFGYGALYKISQRIYKFGGQPVLKETLDKYVFPSERSPTQQFWCNGISGSLIGAGEVVLLPFDVMKIKYQTNPEYRKLNFAQICQQEGLSSLYAGAGVTAARNIAGSFMLFGVNYAVKHSLTDGRTGKPGFIHFALSSTAGSVASILVACPLDVVKTRLQSGNYAGSSAFRIMADIAAKEGIGAFFKGSIPKVLSVGPKLTFSFTLAQYLIDTMERLS